MSFHLHRGVIVALALWTVATVTAITFWPLFPITETRYASVAWEMWSGGHLLVPRFNGELYSHKPPLLFWLWQAGWAVFGVNDWWLRIGTAAIGLAGLFFAHALAATLWPERPGVATQTPVILMGAVLWAVLTPMLMFDVPLAAWALLAVTGVARAARAGRWGWPLAALGIGLGVLTKGPVVLLHCLPVAVMAPLWTRQANWWRWYGGLLLAIGGGAAIALAWALPAAHVGGRAFADAIFWSQTAGRLVKSFAHAQPMWWYLPLIPIVLLPWSLWPAAWRALARLPVREDDGVRFCLIWVGAGFAGLSLISGKQVHYLVPLLPPVALLLARGLDALPPTGRPWTLALALLALALGIGLAPELLDTSQSKWAYLERLPLWPAAALALLAVAAIATRRARVTALAAGLVAVLAIISAGVIAPSRARFDTVPTARLLHRLQAQGHPLARVIKYHGQYHYTGRLTAPIEIIRSPDVAHWAKRNPDGFVIWDYKGDLPLSQVPKFLLCLRGRSFGVWSSQAVLNDALAP